jgi:uncharacterized protein YutE (UPF0331/DUF86 family)
MVDPERVARMLETLATYREHMRSLSELPLDAYLSSHPFEGRYLVQASAQVCIDIANHVISSEGWRVPRDFRDAFTVLREQGVVAEELADSLRDLAGMRNVLVHLYDDVDDERVHEGLRAGLADFELFARAIARLL